MSKDKYGVHISHCCYIHGCKYGDKDCPVESGEVAQKYRCYDCTEENEPYTLEEIKLLRETKSYRPNYKQLKSKITVLEAKLAENKEELLQKEIEISNLRNCEFVTTILDFNKLSADNIRLREQLADMKTNQGKEINRICKTHIEANEKLKQQLAEYEEELKVKEQSRLDWKKRANTYCDLIVSLNDILPNKQEKEITFAKVIDDVKELLAEKEKQIETQKSNIEFLYDLFVSPKGEQTLKAINQDKISFAVEQLERAKESLMRYAGAICNEDGSIKKYDYVIKNSDFEKHIDNQIKQLKEEK